MSRLTSRNNCIAVHSRPWAESVSNGRRKCTLLRSLRDTLPRRKQIGAAQLALQLIDLNHRSYSATFLGGRHTPKSGHRLLTTAWNEGVEIDIPLADTPF
jgi:hypothetical protein